MFIATKSSAAGQIYYCKASRLSFQSSQAQLWFFRWCRWYGPTQERARCDTNWGQSFRNSRQRGPVGCQMSTGTSCRSLGLVRLSGSGQLCLLRPHIPAGQAHFTLITCADLRARPALGGTSQLLELKLFYVSFCWYERIEGFWSKAKTTMGFF